MLSILIPTYNYPIYDLVHELHRQCIEAPIVFEIRTIDDGSKSEHNVVNQKINELSNCTFVALDENIGHSAIRNTLVRKSNYEHLLFIDGDSKVIDNHYIKNYLSELDINDIVHGGRVHPEKCPDDSKKLRWSYGKFVEDKSAEKRKHSFYKTILFNNTYFRKSKFETLRFDETLKQYGHEDTLLAFQISKTNFKVKHIDNPIEHGDIDTSEAFLVKTKKSLENLLQLNQDKKIDPKFISILNLFQNIEKYKLTFFFALYFKIFKGKMVSNLISARPSLFLFNVYRIGYLCYIKNSKI